MFLNLLQDNEKGAFLQLAHYVARSDDDFTAVQKTMIADYCLEMQMDGIAFDASAFDIYKVLAQFQSKKSQKVVLLETLALIYADDFMHEEERFVLEKVLEAFDLSYNLSVVYTQWAKSVLALYIQGHALIEL